MRTQVRDIMVSPVTSMVVSANIAGVKDLMHTKDIHAVPIVEVQGNEITIRGIVTSSDLIGVVDDSAGVVQIMNKRVFVVHPDSSIKAAAQMMLSHHVHHLVVMEEGKIIGIISSIDFVKYIAEN